MATTTIDLNCDLGESFGRYTLGMDQAVMPHITSANIACGYHAGDPSVMDRTVKQAIKEKIHCGAHPGYPDLLGFGRRQMAVGFEDLRNYLIYQIGALQTFCRANGTHLHHVKPHGSLYHAVLDDEHSARALVEATHIIDPELILVTLAGDKSRLINHLAKEHGLKVAFEAFPDRAYTAEGNLAPRSMTNAVITEPEQVVRRAVEMARDRAITAITGERIEFEVHTLCVHGDNPQAVAIVQAIRAALFDNDISVEPVSFS